MGKPACPQHFFVAAKNVSVPIARKSSCLPMMRSLSASGCPRIPFVHSVRMLRHGRYSMQERLKREKPHRYQLRGNLTNCAGGNRRKDFL
jgi:hypothetical protein